MDKNVCAYYRTSSATNVGNDKDSKKRQQHSVKTYAQSKGLNVVNEFYDKGVSGTLDVLNRPSFMEMLNYCQDNAIDTIDIFVHPTVTINFTTSFYIVCHWI